MVDIEFDHMIHYIDGLEHFEFPGKYLEIQKGGRHENLGTFNRLIHINLSYIELLDIFDQGKMKHQSKTQEGKYSFATSIIQNGYKQGFKKICFRTHDIHQLKEDFLARGLEVVGPVKMTRQNKKGHEIHWQLLYVNDHHFDVMMPFFIQWDKSDEDREADLRDTFQTHLGIDMIEFHSHQRQTMTENWQKWFDMDIVEKSNKYTILESPAKKVKFKIVEGKDDRIEGIHFIDRTIQAPILIRTRGASYHFKPEER
ncbi:MULTISPECIES: VOC family protein [unclassified Staphylococcus]|uniref:VOC family protein n=1 Tax=unclassified Staphylococcus TaxID=91994 RepID=UPI0021D0A542|nr:MULTISPECIES: VOC family protein [unclassified Staphylococcus]UXR78002.1 VOC family protein [Staphylococcus sp. IVB6227]UXR82163.1 VOC family protein [Staphylococcus sp. IVB6214]